MGMVAYHYLVDNVSMKSRTHAPSHARQTHTRHMAQKEAIVPAPKKVVLVDPASIAEALNKDPNAKVEIPTFTHTFETKTGNVLTFPDCPVVLKCAQKRREQDTWNLFNPVAKIEGNEYVEDTTFVGRDRTAAKTGFYRICKAADKANQTEWRQKRAEALEAAQAAGVVDADLNVVEETAPEAPAKAPRKRPVKKEQAA
jgi:Cu/Ag efflux protein CusF